MVVGIQGQLVSTLLTARRPFSGSEGLGIRVDERIYVRVARGDFGYCANEVKENVDLEGQ